MVFLNHLFVTFFKTIDWPDFFVVTPISILNRSCDAWCDGRWRSGSGLVQIDVRSRLIVDIKILTFPVENGNSPAYPDVEYGKNDDGSQTGCCQRMKLRK